MNTDFFKLLGFHHLPRGTNSRSRVLLDRSALPHQVQMTLVEDETTVYKPNTQINKYVRFQLTSFVLNEKMHFQVICILVREYVKVTRH